MATLKKFSGLFALLGGLLLAGCSTTAKTKEECGPLPADAHPAIEKILQDELPDPDSAELHYEPATIGRFKPDKSDTWNYAWKVKVWVRQKDTAGHYTRAEPYWFFFSKGRMIRKIRPSEVPEDEWKDM